MGTAIASGDEPQFIAPASDTEMCEQYLSYAKGLLIKCGVPKEHAGDAVQDVFERLIARGVREKYDPAHTVTHQGQEKRCTFRAYLSGIIALYARGIREKHQAAAKREMFLFDAPGEDGGPQHWAEALAGQWLDDYPSLSDQEYIDRIRAWLALQPPEARWVPATGERETGGSDLLTLFDDIAAEVAGPQRTAKAKAAWAALRGFLRDTGAAPAPEASWDIGGLTVSPESLNEAVRLLEASTSVMVLEPLRRGGHPLGDAPDKRWYHEFSRAERAAFPHLEIDPSTHKRPAGHVKLAVLHRMRRMLAEAAMAAEAVSPVPGEGGTGPDSRVESPAPAAAVVPSPSPAPDDEPAPWERIEAVLWELGASANVVGMCQEWAAEGGMAVPA